MSCASTIGRCDAPLAVEPPTACERPEVDVPAAVVACREADIFAGAGAGDVDPAPLAADAAMGADRPALQAVRICQRRQFRRPGAWCGGLEGRRRWQITRVVRPLRVELRTEARDALLLRAAVGRWGACGCGFQGTRPAVMTAML